MCYNHFVKTAVVNARAKLNLTLDILGKCETYHEIDSLCVSVDLCDRIVVRSRRDSLVRVIMHGMGSEYIPPETNSAYRAAELFQSAFQTKGADITVYKNIPMGAGMGGSSVDAAGVLRAMAKIYEKDLEALFPLARKLSSDAPFLLCGGLQRMRGRGEKLTPIAQKEKLCFFLLVPPSGVDTSKCYALCDETEEAPHKTEDALKKLEAGDIAGACAHFSNGLSSAAEKLCPDILKAREELFSFSPLCVNMTGSGSGVYAVFETMELCAWAKSRYRGKFKGYLLKSQGEY